jgi:hypothetical protein
VRFFSLSHFHFTKHLSVCTDCGGTVIEYDQAAGIGVFNLEQLPEKTQS